MNEKIENFLLYQYQSLKSASLEYLNHDSSLISMLDSSSAMCFIISACIFLLLLSIILGLISGLAETAAYLSFMTDLDLESFFDFKKIKKIFIRNFKPFIKYICWGILIKIAYCLLSIVLLITIIGAFLLPILEIYCAAIYSDLQAQFLRHAIKIKSN